MSGERNHAQLGASNAGRWMNCPGSVAAEAGLPAETSVHAQEGTAAHALAKIAWDQQRIPDEWIGEELEGVVVSPEMASNVAFYLGYLARIAEGASEVFTEEKFDLAPIKPPVPMFGTADFVAVHQPRGHLDVIDLKYGKGVKVEAVGNPQGRFYALGAWVALAVRNYAAAQQIKTVSVCIVQPRILDENGEPSVSSEIIPIQELRVWANELLEAARRTQLQMAPRVAGDWCRWCKAKATCPEFRTKALAVAQLEFPEIEARLPDPMALAPEQIAKILEHRKLLEEWLSSVEVFALGELEQGRPIPGWARAPKRATRKWRNEKEAAARLAEEFGADDTDIYEQKIKSPAQIEKLVGKGNLPEDLVVAESSGFNLVRDTDKRAVPAATLEFPAIPASTPVLEENAL